MLLNLALFRELQKSIDEILRIFKDNSTGNPRFSTIAHFADLGALTKFQLYLEEKKLELVPAETDPRLYRLLDETCKILDVQTPYWVVRANYKPRDGGLEWVAYSDKRLLRVPSAANLFEFSDLQIKETLAHEIKHLQQDATFYTCYEWLYRALNFSLVISLLLLVTGNAIDDELMIEHSGICTAFTASLLVPLFVLGCYSREREFEADANILKVSTAESWGETLDEFSKTICSRIFGTDRDGTINTVVTVTLEIFQHILEPFTPHPSNWSRRENLRRLEQQAAEKSI